MNRKQMRHKQFRRKYYLINFDFQARYIGLLIALASLMCLIFVMAAKYYINLNLGPLVESGLITSPLAKELIDVQKSFLNKNLLTIFLFTIGFITLIGVYLTHRIVGPLFALERHMAKIKDEGLQSARNLVVRERDEFIELVDSYNDMTRSIKKEMAKKDVLIEKFQKQKNKRVA